MNPPLIPVSEKTHLASPRLQRIMEYYGAATHDYRAWSREFHMHFGYWRWGLNPFRREPMLEELSLQVLKRLQKGEIAPERVADLGGGVGATARLMVKTWSDTTVDVVTVSPLQIEIGQMLARDNDCGARIQWRCCDYEHSPLASDHYDAVCLIESSCYAQGADKRGLMKEILRILKPGGLFVIVDAMLRKPIPAVGVRHAWRRKMYRTWCDAWAIPELCQIDQLREATEQLGGEITAIEDWSYRIAPSVAHAPGLVMYHLIVETYKARGLLSTWRWRHLVASFLSPWIGLLERNFVYAAVCGKRKG